jgi:hypothetical protein
MLSDFPAEKNLLFLFAKHQSVQAMTFQIDIPSCVPAEMPLQCRYRTRSHRIEEQFLRKAAPHHDGKSSFQICLGIGMAIVDRQLLRDPERRASGDDCDFVKWICPFGQHCDYGVSRFVICRHALFHFH